MFTYLSLLATSNGIWSSKELSIFAMYFHWKLFVISDTANKRSSTQAYLHGTYIDILIAKQFSENITTPYF